MTRGARWFASLAILGSFIACDKPAPAAEASADSAIVKQRESRIDSALFRSSRGGSGLAEPVAQWHLPAALNDIAGLALTANGRLLTHGNDRGRVFEIDYRRGIVVKEFSVGSPAVHGDFEAVTTVGDAVLLLTSGGVLYRFPEGANGAAVQFTMRDTGLGDECDIEGMAYDAAARTLLLACKKVHDRALKDSVVLFRVPLEPGADAHPERPPHLAIPFARIIGANDWDSFHPSDITIDPSNGNYVMVASREKAIAEVTPAGAVVFSRPLPPGHEHTEGVAITKDHILIIGDEARGGPALITLYRWPP